MWHLLRAGHLGTCALQVRKQLGAQVAFFECPVPSAHPALPPVYID